MRAETDAQFREFVAAHQAALLSTACLLAGDWASGEDRRWRAARPTAQPPDIPVGDHTEHADNRDLLWHALRALPDGQRAVLVLRFHADMTEAQAAESLGISVGTVKSQTSRALAKLRSQLAAELVTDGGR